MEGSLGPQYLHLYNHGNHSVPPIIWNWNDIPKNRYEPVWIKSLEVGGAGVTDGLTHWGNRGVIRSTAGPVIKNQLSVTISFPGGVLGLYQALGNLDGL